MNKRKKSDTSLLTRAILLIRAGKDKLSAVKPIHRIKDRQKALSHYSEKNRTEESGMAYIFGLLKVIFSILLILLLLTTFLFGKGTISYEKMYYMFKDIAYIRSYGEGVPKELSYSHPIRNQVYADFKNGLLAASDSELKIFTSTGRVTLTEGSEFANPRVICSDNSALIYDQGRNMYSIYNSFVKLYSEKTEYKIAAADMSDNGSYLILTKSKLYSSVVKIYDNNYGQIGEYSKNDIVISASISDDGRFAAMVSLSAAGAKTSAKLDVLDCKKNQIISQTSFDGLMPYTCEFLSDNRIAVFADDRFVIVNKKGDTLIEYNYPSGVENLDISDNGFAVLFSKTGLYGDKILEVFGSEGQKIFSHRINENVRDIKMGGGNIYYLTASEIIRINISLGTESRVLSSADSEKIVLFQDGKVMTCSQNSAAYISFD